MHRDTQAETKHNLCMHVDALKPPPRTLVALGPLAEGLLDALQGLQLGVLLGLCYVYMDKVDCEGGWRERGREDRQTDR